MPMKQATTSLPRKKAKENNKEHNKEHNREVDREVDKALRPQNFSEFIGQKQSKKNLQLYIQAAKQREESLDHTLLSGAAGLGKTSLALLIAKSMNYTIKVTSAPIITQPKDLIGILSSLDKNSILFIDELHRLRPQVEEILYPAMENFALDWVIGKGIEARSMRVPIEPFTLVGASTQVGKLSLPFLSRFGIREHLHPYTIPELAEIILHSATLLKIEITTSACQILAKVSRQTPRTANALLCRVRDFCQVVGKQKIDVSMVNYACREMDIDEHGLETVDRQILRLLIDVYKGKPVGLKALATTINESELTIEEYREPFLIQSGFVQRTPRGRCATPKAFHIYGTSAGSKTYP